MRTVTITILILTVAAAALATTNIPDVDNCYAELPEGPLPRYLTQVPDGSGPPLSDARVDGGASYSGVITLWVINMYGDPIANYPAEDIWFGDTCGATTYCSLPNPDDASDENGMTEFTGPYAAGGYMPPGCLVQVFIAGSPLQNGLVELRFNSPDITGDLNVNLSDITLFTQAIATYDWAADFNSDGLINLTDITIMAQAIGAGCP